MPPKKSPRFYVIGDIHFKYLQIREGQEFIDKCVASVTAVKPDYIVLLGDTLDSHEVSRNGPFKLVEQLLEKLSTIAIVYVLIGNHDLINQRQFLTDAHFFGPYKKWPNIIIVDKPTRLTVGEMNFIFCPYVETGRLIEALETLKDVPNERADEFFDWTRATCIFGHSEVSGALISDDRWSVKGDVWDPSFPIAIFGHLHTEQTVGENVYYPGSSTQVTMTESPDKRVWVVSFTVDTKDKEVIVTPLIKKIDLKLKWKKEITVALKEVEKIPLAEAEKYHLRIKISCSHEQFKAFKKSVCHAKFTSRGATLVCDPLPSTSLASLGLKSLSKNQTTFQGVLEQLIKTKSNEIREAYERVLEMHKPVDDLQT